MDKVQNCDSYSTLFVFIKARYIPERLIFNTAMVTIQYSEYFKKKFVGNKFENVSHCQTRYESKNVCFLFIFIQLIYPVIFIYMRLPFEK
jgi:hypothetical protein